MEKKELLEIIKFLGGKNNLIKFWNCMTRLRFQVKDESKIDFDKIKEIKGVLGTQKQNDQYQVIVGPSANKYFEILKKRVRSK